MVPFQKYPVEFKVCENIAPPKARMCQKAGNRWILISANIWSPHWSNQYNTHWIHVWYIYLHLHWKSTKRRWIYHTRILWDMECQSCHVRFLIVDLLFLISPLVVPKKTPSGNCILKRISGRMVFQLIPSARCQRWKNLPRKVLLQKWLRTKLPFKKGWSFS